MTDINSQKVLETPWLGTDRWKSAIYPRWAGIYTLILHQKEPDCKDKCEELKALLKEMVEIIYLFGECFFVLLHKIRVYLIEYVELLLVRGITTG